MTAVVEHDNPLIFMRVLLELSVAIKLDFDGGLVLQSVDDNLWVLRLGVEADYNHVAPEHVGRKLEEICVRVAPLI